ncbi:MAG: NHLP-related RiPP peptide [Xanthomonadales bacterium]|nr:NHLP-related RiPP peptide [Xanthomonadales bacterium]
MDQPVPSMQTFDVLRDKEQPASGSQPERQGQLPIEPKREGAGMLSLDQGTELLRRLSRDDAFRSLFQSSPKSALIEMGMAPEEIARLCPSCLEPCSLAPKRDFEAALKETSANEIFTAMQMMVPRVRL